MKKLVFALVLVVALLVVALPAAAQGPAPTPWFVRAAGTNEDPFGGLPLYNDQKASAMSAKFLDPALGSDPVPGGVPSDKSGDGTSPRKAVYIGGAWAAQQPSKGFGIDVGEHPQEIPSCVTMKIPAGQNRWFKYDSWKWAPSKASKTGYPIQTQVWVDDELDGATKPSGSAVFGAANLYSYGIQAWDGWSGKLDANYDSTSYSVNSGPHSDGFVTWIYPPDMLQPNFQFAAPNAWIFTVNVGSSGSLSRSAPGQAGVSNSILCQPPVSAKLNFDQATGLITSGIIGICKDNVGYAQYNPDQPSHLLFYQSQVDGWSFARVLNQMVWDGTASVCSYRDVQKGGR